MITLSNINISHVLYPRIDLAGIRLGVGGGGRGQTSPIPGLGGVLGLYSGKGLTNELMSANPVWKDKSGLGNDLQMKNFLWKLGSGCGSYAQDWRGCNSNNGALLEKSKNSTSGFVKFTLNNPIGISLTYWQNTDFPYNNKRMTFKFDSNVTDKEFSLAFVSNDGVTILESFPLHIGINEIPAVSEDTFANLSKSTPGIRVSAALSVGDWFSIEEIPDYSGAIVFDGVDDYGICETFPILTKEKGYTVMALRKWLSDNDNQCFASNRTGGNAAYNAFNFELIVSNLKTTRSFSTSSVRVSYPPLVSYQTSRDYNGTLLIPEFDTGNKTLLVGTLNSNSYFSNVALYSLVIIDHDTTEEERQMVIDYWKKEFPWLFFDQAWTVTGKTNEDSDRATIANLTGNGNYLVLSNFSFADNSGYGLYNMTKFDNWIYVTERGDIVRSGYSVTITNSIVTGSTTNYNADILYTYTNPGIKMFKVTGLVNGQKIFFGRKSATEAYVVDKDGLYRSDYNIPASDGKAVVGIGTVDFTGEGNITIEQIPDYEGYLVTDGVDDKVVSSAFGLSKDWTIVGDWKFIPVDRDDLAGVSKSSSFFLYNYAAGIRVYINSTASAITIDGVRSINAICSDGRIYLNDWTEVINDKNQTVSVSSLGITIGYNGTNFTQVAFKNLGIYNNRILSKEQCIQAYNYLQTLKNK